MKKLILLYQQIKGENNMTTKPNKKRTVETINIKIPTSEVLISYALIYSKLNNEGKEQAQQQLKLIGQEYDLMKEKINKIEDDILLQRLNKERNKGGQ